MLWDSNSHPMCSPPKDQAKELLMPGLENTRLLRDIHSLAQCALANGHENEKLSLNSKRYEIKRLGKLLSFGNRWRFLENLVHAVTDSPKDRNPYRIC